MKKLIVLFLGCFGATQAMKMDVVEMFNIADNDAVEYVFKDSGHNKQAQKKAFKKYIQNVRSNNTPAYQIFITAVHMAQKIEALGNSEQVDTYARALQTIQKTVINFSAQQQQLVQHQVTRNNSLEQRNADSMAVATCVNAVTLLALFVLLSYVGNCCT